MGGGGYSPPLPPVVEAPKVVTKEDTDLRAFEESKKAMMSERERKANTILTSAQGLSDTGLSLQSAGLQAKKTLLGGQ